MGEKLKLFFHSILKDKKRLALTIAGLTLLFLGYVFLHLPPADFPIGQVITIDSGESLQSITNQLFEEHVIKSPIVFRTTVILLGGEKKVKAGDYLLDKREGPADLAFRFVNGQYHLVTTKITIPEGWDIHQMADYLQKTLINFDKTQFLSLAKGFEGYLFPDTYFISPAIKPQKLIDMMKNNFDFRTSQIAGMSTTTRSIKDIITVASILEEETKTINDRRIVAGIIWKRLSLKMPLQVDSTLSYITGKTTYQLTQTDLQINSSYNTYKYLGLPPMPISNPGADAIFSALNPINTKYLYFLSSKSGTMYYATTFDQHERNRELYLYK